MFNLIWFAIFSSWHYFFFIACRGKTPSNSDVSTRNLYWQIWTDRSHPWVHSTTNSRIHRRIHRVFNVAGLGACSQYQFKLPKLQDWLSAQPSSEAAMVWTDTHAVSRLCSALTLRLRLMSALRTFGGAWDNRDSTPLRLVAAAWTRRPTVTSAVPTWLCAAWVNTAGTRRRLDSAPQPGLCSALTLRLRVLINTRARDPAGAGHTEAFATNCLRIGSLYRKSIMEQYSVLINMRARDPPGPGSVHSCCNCFGDWKALPVWELSIFTSNQAPDL